MCYSKADGLLCILGHTFVSGGGHDRGEDDKLFQVRQRVGHRVQIERAVRLGHHRRIPALPSLCVGASRVKSKSEVPSLALLGAHRAAKRHGSENYAAPLSTEVTVFLHGHPLPNISSRQLARLESMTPDMALSQAGCRLGTTGA